MNNTTGHEHIVGGEPCRLCSKKTKSPSGPPINTIEEILNSFGTDCSFRNLTGDAYKAKLTKTTQAISTLITQARIDGAKEYNRVLTATLGKPTYMDDDGERHTVYKQVWVGDAIRKANAEVIAGRLSE